MQFFNYHNDARSNKHQILQQSSVSDDISFTKALGGVPPKAFVNEILSPSTYTDTDDCIILCYVISFLW